MRTQITSVLDSLYAKTSSISMKARGLILSTVLAASFLAQGAASIAQGASFTSHVATPQGLVRMHPAPDCSGGGTPC